MSPEYIAEGQRYGVIKKAFSINIMYFRLGQGLDYIYEYQGNFVGRKQKDVLNPSNRQKNKYFIQTVADIFPKYYIVRVGNYKEDAIDEPIDEWVYFLKYSKIKDNFKAKGMEKAKEVLKFENMPDEQKRSYQRHIENKRIEMGVMETLIDKVERKKEIEIAKKALLANVDYTTIMTITSLTLEEISSFNYEKNIQKLN